MARDVGERLELLWSRGSEASGDRRGGQLPPAFAARVEGELSIPLRADRPTIASNFVTTLDGVVAMTVDGRSGGGDVSGFSEPDRLVMALLRTLADAVIVASGTFGADPGHEWTPRRVHPGTAEASAAWRSELGLAPQPTTIVVTGSGRLDPAHPGLNAPDVPVVVVTTEGGAAELRRRGLPDRVRVVAAGAGTRVAPGEIVAAASAVGVRLAVCEGGPRLYAELLAAGLVDEAFLTLAPQLAGRGAGVERRSLVDGVALGQKSGRWGELRSVHRAANHLFLRYALEG